MSMNTRSGSRRSNSSSRRKSSPLHTYNGISYPQRAESLNDFGGYKVFLEHWGDLTDKIRIAYERVALQRATHAILLFGPQGSGKTLFSRKLVDDFDYTKSNITKYKSSDNLWAKITAGSNFDQILVDQATINTSILHIEDQDRWVDRLKEWKKINSGRHCIVIVDNSERAYFFKGLVRITDVQYVKMSNDPGLITLAAQRFVELSRKELQGCLFIMLTNNEVFSRQFTEQVDSQHRGLLNYLTLPIPANKDKETIVRVNVNRLNEITYWYCLDRAGPEAKQRVYQALIGNETFPGSFNAVHEAISNSNLSRKGRPAAKCTLSVLCFSNSDDFHSFNYQARFTDQPVNAWSDKWLNIYTFDTGWARSVITDQRTAYLLESEWNLRLVLLGNPFVSCLIGDESHRKYASQILNHLETPFSIGHTHDQRETYWKEAQRLMSEIPDNRSDTSTFWERDQLRYREYEGAMKAIYPTYNTVDIGFLNYRPDYVIESYDPCTILNSPSDEVASLNVSIKRKAHVFELTAIKSLTCDRLITYLSGKMKNYIDILQNQ